MIQVICLLLVISTLISVSFAKGLYHSNLKLKEEIMSLTKAVGKEKKNKEELVIIVVNQMNPNLRLLMKWKLLKCQLTM